MNLLLFYDTKCMQLNIYLKGSYNKKLPNFIPISIFVNTLLGK
jgi:hypothetical protein